MFDEEVIKVFLKNQGQLFDEPVAGTPEEAEEFLEDCLAQVVNSEKEVYEYFEEAGIDADGEELLEASEVFEIGDGRYLLVEA